MKNSVETYLLFLLFFLAFAGPLGLIGWYYDILSPTLTLVVAVGFPVGGSFIVLVASFLFPAAGTWREEDDEPSRASTAVV